MSGEGEEIILPFIDSLVLKTYLPIGVASKENPITIPQFVKNMDTLLGKNIHVQHVVEKLKYTAV